MCVSLPRSVCVYTCINYIKSYINIRLRLWEAEWETQCVCVYMWVFIVIVVVCRTCHTRNYIANSNGTSKIVDLYDRARAPPVYLCVLRRKKNHFKARRMNTTTTATAEQEKKRITTATAVARRWTKEKWAERNLHLKQIKKAKARSKNSSQRTNKTPNKIVKIIYIYTCRRV